MVLGGQYFHSGYIAVELMSGVEEEAISHEAEDLENAATGEAGGVSLGVGVEAVGEEGAGSWGGQERVVQIKATHCHNHVIY
jgi:hypothetical protein